MAGRNSNLMGADIPDSGNDPTTGKPVKRSTGKWGWNTIYGRDDDQGSPYMTRIWLGRLRLHIFHHGDTDPDPHSHPWKFFTFPLHSYVEEVTIVDSTGAEFGDGVIGIPRRFLQIVPAFRISARPATHCHKVIGRFAGDYDHHGSPYTDNGKIVTIIWRGHEERQWGFLKNRDGKWCWQVWKEYILAGGKNQPCE